MLKFADSSHKSDFGFLASDLWLSSFYRGQHFRYTPTVIAERSSIEDQPRRPTAEMHGQHISTVLWTATFGCVFVWCEACLPVRNDGPFFEMCTNGTWSRAVTKLKNIEIRVRFGSVVQLCVVCAGFAVLADCSNKQVPAAALSMWRKPRGYAICERLRRHVQV